MNEAKTIGRRLPVQAALPDSKLRRPRRGFRRRSLTGSGSQLVVAQFPPGGPSKFGGVLAASMDQCPIRSLADPVRLITLTSRLTQVTA